MKPAESEQEKVRLAEFLKQVDQNYYHRTIQNRKDASCIFPHQGEEGKLFINTFGYVNLFKKL